MSIDEMFNKIRMIKVEQILKQYHALKKELGIVPRPKRTYADIKKEMDQKKAKERRDSLIRYHLLYQPKLQMNRIKNNTKVR